jgi:putative ABC transport system permease protein
MGLYLKIAWRNLWRNKKRTIITISSVVFAVILATFTRAMQLGSYDRMIDNSTKQYTGQIQIHSKAYKETESIDNSMDLNDSTMLILDRNKDIHGYSPRIESFTLISTDDKTKGAMLIGIDPEKEKSFNRIDQKLIAGRYFSENEKAVMIAEGLAKKMSISVNDTIVFFSQGMYGMTAAAKYPVAGILKYPIPEQNDLMTFLPLKEAQYFYSADGKITSISIQLNEYEKIASVKSDLSALLDKDLIIEDWKELLPDLVQMIDMDSASGLLIIAILYGVIGFGLFGTAMMIALERKKELATLYSIGLKRIKMILMVSLETIMLSITGFVIGITIAIPVIYYFNIYPIEFSGEMAEMMLSYGFEPIMPTSTDMNILFSHGLIVFTLSLITCVYPALMIARIRSVTTLKI